MLRLMKIRLHFLGAAGTVTGSKYLLELGRRRFLIDCGLFQGYKPLRLRNWASLPVEAQTIEAVILSHAHIDHSGYLPLLVKKGFKGKVYCTPATRDLCGILLPDSGHLQEEEARYANRKGYSKHHPAEPLYTEDEARASLKHLHSVRFGADVDLGSGIVLRFLSAGHILGAAIVELRIKGQRLVFSGDLGRPNDLIMKPPTQLEGADWLLVESTYGDRLHNPADPRVQLAEVIRRTAAHGGVVLIPTFAVGRAQALLYLIHLLREQGEIPPVPVFLNSPMAIDATELWRAHHSEHRLTLAQCEAMRDGVTLVNSVDDSIALNARRGPMVILAASGMATGGRVLHHLKAFAGDARNVVLFAGYQAGGTRGAAMLAGAKFIKIHGEQIAVRASIEMIDNLSAHADSDELMDWLRAFRQAPKRTFVVHGEPTAADALRRRIQDELHWGVDMAEDRQVVSLDEPGQA